jgi:hypothetical protein
MGGMPFFFKRQQLILEKPLPSNQQTEFVFFYAMDADDNGDG